MDADERELIVKLATSSASLATSPGDRDNWVERAGTGGRGGELPPYVRKIARAIMKTGKTKSRAIAIAISRIKRWALGGDNVKADTRMKAVKALAQWEALKLKNKAHKVVGLSSSEGDYLALSQTEFNTDMIGQAWDSVRDVVLHGHTGSEESGISGPEGPHFPYITELWNTFIIVKQYRTGQPPLLFKVPYTVKGSRVEFGQPVAVKATFEPLESELTDNETVLLSEDIQASEED